MSGVKIGWAFAQRTLIAAELLFGTTSGSITHLGWLISLQNRNERYTVRVAASRATVLFNDLFIDNVLQALERLNARRWGAAVARKLLRPKATGGAELR